jgi:hypothetical protein
LASAAVAFAGDNRFSGMFTGSVAADRSGTTAGITGSPATAATLLFGLRLIVSS